MEGGAFSQRSNISISLCEKIDRREWRFDTGIRTNNIVVHEWRQSDYMHVENKQVNITLEFQMTYWSYTKSGKGPDIKNKYFE